MADLEDFTKWLWTLPTAAVGYVVWTIRDKVSSRTCVALHNGLQQEMDDFKKHVDTRIDDLKDFSRSQTGLIIGEIKKTGK